jgi:serine/threonine protein kinase
MLHKRVHREPRELRPGDGLGRYELLLPVARGGMGQVWAARLRGARGFQKVVAVKTILASDEDSSGLRSMLLAEASLASHVHHPNVIEMMDLGEQDGTPYLVMEWVDGGALDHVMRSATRAGAMPLPVAANLIIHACKGLHAAHEARDADGNALGIVHRDISPQNLLVSYAGTLKLVDFGVAKAMHLASQPSVAGQVKGKFAYMSPEQARGEPINARTDIFAMGVVLYLLTAGRHPFKGETPADTLRRILCAEPVVRPRELVAGYPPQLEAVVMKALAKDKEERFESAHEMCLALGGALTPAPETDVREFMHRLFGEQMAQRARTLKRAMEAADAKSTDRQSRRSGPHIPRRCSTIGGISIHTDDGVHPVPSSRRHRAGAVAVCLSLLALALGWGQQHSPPLADGPRTGKANASAAIAPDTARSAFHPPEGPPRAPEPAEGQPPPPAPTTRSTPRHVADRARTAPPVQSTALVSAPPIAATLEPPPKAPDWDPLRARK